MSTARDSLPRLAWVVFLVLWFLRPGAALAGSDYSDVPFSLRLPPAFIRFTEVSAGGGGTSASRWSSAVNPASAGWMELPYKFGEFPPAWVKSTGVPQQVVVRPGVSYEYADYSTVFLDYQFGFFDNDLGGHFYNHRFSTGVDHRLLEWLFVRAGASVDVRGNAGVTCGVGIHLSRHCGLDVGYQYDVLPELRPEFGRAHVVQITFSLRLCTWRQWK